MTGENNQRAGSPPHGQSWQRLGPMLTLVDVSLHSVPQSTSSSIRPMLRNDLISHSKKCVPVLRAQHRHRIDLNRAYSCRAFSNDTDNAPKNQVIERGSENHHDIESFRAYAERVNLIPTKTVYVGTLYEYTVAESLHRLGFDLTRTGRASDQGIDLLGIWKLPNGLKPLRVLAQCKAVSRSIGPNIVRELEGAFAGVPAEWRKGDILGLLATKNKATKGVTEAMGRSRWPMGFLKISSDGCVEQFIWNQMATETGLEGLGVTSRYVHGDNAVRKDISLTWMGRPFVHGEAI